MKVLELAGASNVRDIGGYAAADGRRVAHGRVLRSASLAALTVADQAALAAIPVRAIVDLRGVAEREHAPSAVTALGAETHHLPIEPFVGASLRDIAARREATGADAMDMLRVAYAAYAADWSHHMAALLRLAANPAAHALLFHCSAGKDRTGFATAVLLTTLGVAWDDVLADYVATNDLWRPDATLASVLPPAIADVMLRAHPGLLDHAFATIAERHGGFDGYRRDALGLDDAALARLRDALLT